jgi:hypothetical protein
MPAVVAWRGATIIGGDWTTTPDHVAALRLATKGAQGRKP